MLTFSVLKDHFDYFFTNVNKLKVIIKLKGKCYKFKICARFHQITLFDIVLYFFQIKT